MENSLKQRHKEELEFFKSCKGKKALLLPRMETKNKDNRNEKNSPMALLIKVAEYLGSDYTFDENEFYDFAIGRWSGEDLFTEGTSENKVYKSGKPFIELYWDVLNGGFFFDRFSEEGKIYSSECSCCNEVSSISNLDYFLGKITIDK